MVGVVLGALAVARLSDSVVKEHHFQVRQGRQLQYLLRVSPSTLFLRRNPTGTTWAKHPIPAHARHTKYCLSTSWLLPNLDPRRGCGSGLGPFGSQGKAKTRFPYDLKMAKKFPRKEKKHLRLEILDWLP